MCTGNMTLSLSHWLDRIAKMVTCFDLIAMLHEEQSPLGFILSTKDVTATDRDEIK